MLITVIFLMSCIITARLLEKHKMHVASIAYSVLFAVLLVALLFTVDVEFISSSLSNLIGASNYTQANEALLYVLHSAGYGTCIYVFLFLSLFLQAALLLIYTVATVVTLFKKGRVAHISKKDNYRCPHTHRALCLNKHINLLYCRMLN